MPARKKKATRKTAKKKTTALGPSANGELDLGMILTTVEDDGKQYQIDERHLPMLKTGMKPQHVAVLQWRAAGKTWEQVSALSGMSVHGARDVVDRFPEIVKAIRAAHQLRILTSIEKATQTQIEIAEDPENRRSPDAYKNLIAVGHPKESHRTEVHVGDKYEDNRQAVSVTIENVEHLSMEELKARLDERWQRFLRPPAP